MSKFPDRVRGSLMQAGALARATAPVVARDGVGLGGLAAIVRGVWMIHPAAGWIALGLLMVGVAALWSIASAKRSS